MPLQGTDGIQQNDAAKNLQLISPLNIELKLATNTGVTEVNVQNSDSQKCITIGSDKNVRIHGNLTVEGTHTTEHSSEVNIGDKVLNLNAGIEDVSQNSYGGLFIKRISSTVGQVLPTISFVASTNTINISGGPGSLTSGDLFFVRGSKKNDGLYKVSTIGASTIVINTSATEYDVRTSFVDETVVAHISEAIPAYLLYDNGWKLGVFSPGAVTDTLTIVGQSSIESGVDYSGTHPNIGCQGTTNAGSGASKVGIYSSSLDYFTTAPTQVQTLAEQTNSAFKDLVSADGAKSKHGVTDISNDSDSVSITFTTAFSTSISSVVCSLENTTDTTPFHYTTMITSKSVTGFTVKLSSKTDTANYKLNWNAKGV